MTTSIVLEIHSDDEPLASEVRRIAELPEGSIERLTILVAIHQFEAQRIYERIGAIRTYETY